jgi:hypothetical protein
VPAAETKPYDEEFRDRLQKIEADVLELGLNFTVICSRAGISRATPDRWKRHTPKTIALVAKVESIIAEERAKLPRRRPARKRA